MSDPPTSTPDTPEARALTPGLNRLVESIRREVVPGREPAEIAGEVAGHLADALQDPELLAERHCEPADDGYRQHILHVEPDGSFSVVCLVWLPGQETPVHDHVSWCVPGIARGREQETRYRLVGASREEAADHGGARGARRAASGHSGAPHGDASLEDACLVETDREINEPGTVVTLTPPGDIHHVRNPGPGRAVSIHVYGADISELGSSIRRCYDLPIRREDAES